LKNIYIDTKFLEDYNLFVGKIIEINNLKKYYKSDFKTIKAVDGVSFAVEKGETFGFLGPNGAGKSTTIRCIMDFIRPTEGEIKIFGLDAHENSVTLKKKIGYLPGNVKLNPKWTGTDHIKYVESIRGKSEIVVDLMDKLDFNPSKKFKQLSSGNKQKLGLILAIMNEPDILIMDEPTVGLDPLLQNSIYDILGELKKKGTTVFISSHNLPEVERLCSRVGIIKEGKMVAVETMRQLGEKKLHRIEIRFKDGFKKEDFEGPKVERIEELKDGLIITAGGDINPIVKKLAKHELKDVDITHASLEEVFLKFYERKKYVWCFFQNDEG
jgi:ABC-2 type transport system ATP-binding protein